MDNIQPHIDKATEYLKTKGESQFTEGYTHPTHSIAESQIAQAIALQGIGNLLEELVQQTDSINVNLQAIWQAMVKRDR